MANADDYKMKNYISNLSNRYESLSAASCSMVVFLRKYNSGKKGKYLKEEFNKLNCKVNSSYEALVSYLDKTETYSIEYPD